MSHLIDADVLIDEIKKETKKAIDEGDKVGSFWLGYAAGFVIKQPTIQSALDPETLIRTIETGIIATNSSDAYSLGMRNGMRWCKSLIDGAEPKFEEMSVDNGKDLPSIQPEPQWIPVSERLPSKEERKEWIDNNLDGIGYLYPCLVTRYLSINPDRTKNNPYVAKHYFDGEDFLNAGEEVCSEYIIAWMPLPEAYKQIKENEQ